MKNRYDCDLIQINMENENGRLMTSLLYLNEISMDQNRTMWWIGN